MLHIPHIHNTPESIEVQLPPSKSILNRLLLMDALSGYPFDRNHKAAGNDCILMHKALNTSFERFSFEDAGTPLRLYVSYAALKGIPSWIEGTPRLTERPLKPLLIALESLGCEFEYRASPYMLPLRVLSPVDTKKHLVEIDGRLSSQFISALMLIAPYFKDGLTLHCLNSGQSIPYIQMTAALMQNAGIQVQLNGDEICIHTGQYNTKAMDSAEADWSAAGFIYAWAAARPGMSIQLPGLKVQSLQGDAAAVDIFAKLGVVTREVPGGICISGSIEPASTQAPVFNLMAHTDLFPALVAACAFQKIPAVFTGIYALRHKESDRLTAMRDNLIQCGALIKSLDDHTARLEYGTKTNASYTFNAFDDHRIAMACSLFAFEKDIQIDGHESVRKSFPGYWKVMEALR